MNLKQIPAALHVHEGTRIPLRVVFVEDCPVDIELAVGLLVLEGFEVECARVETSDALACVLSGNKPDVVLSDFRMPRFDGMSALHVVRELAPDVPFIFLSGAIGEERAIEALQLGAADYVLKDRPQRLGAAVRRAIDHARRQQDYERRIEQYANYDRLLEIPNRRLLEDRGTQALAHARRSRRPCAVFLVNVDRFSLINQTHGHRAGDELLRQIARRLQDVLRDGDTLARFGSDVFAVLAADLTRAEDAVHIGRRIRDCTHAAFSLGEHELRVTVSTGISTSARDADTFETLLRNAATAASRAREEGGNQYQFYLPQMNERAQNTLRLQAELARAIEQQQFALYYQPKVHIGGGHVTGLEALLRWNHPVRGLVAPGDFIPVLEDTGLVIEVGEWVIVSACRQIRAWQAQGLTVPPIAINLCARQFQQKDLAAFVRTAIEVSGIDARLLEFELTESILMRDAAETIHTIQALKASGVSLAIDDFGTGYSSLAYLRRFPVDALKIDRTFIADVPTREEDAAIAQAIIRLGHTLQFKVIAEGVETPGQLSFLTRHGCDEIQGYYFSPPLAAPQMAVLLGENKRLQRPASAADTGERTLLLVDAEENVLSALKRLLRGENYCIYTAGDPRSAGEILSAHRVGVVVSDQRIPGSTGVDFLRRVKEFYPETVRIVLSGYTDLDTVTEAVNQGAIYRFVTKPWDDESLRAHIADAFRHFAAMCETRRAHDDMRARIEELTRANRALQAALEAQRRESAVNERASAPHPDGLK